MSNTLFSYRPHPLLRSGHLQTLMVGFVNGHAPAYNARTFTVPTHDDEALVVHEELGGPLATSAPLVILVHGLGGDHRSAYLQRLAPQLRQLGFQVWRVDLRGCGQGIDHAWKPANAGVSDDLAAVCRAALDQCPSRRIHLVGFSLSGNIVLKMLGEAATGRGHIRVEPEQIASALAIAPPVDLHACADNMDRLSRRPYTTFYLKHLDKQTRQRRNRWTQWQAVPMSPKVRTIRQFDARYTAPLSGFSGTDDYYTRSSAAQLLKKITTPTTILFDEHDPIVPAKSILAASFNEESTLLVPTRWGGHMGYFGIGEDRQLVRWMECYVIHHLRRFL